MINPLRLIGRAPVDGVLFVDHLNMAPTLRRDSVAFLGPKNQWVGEGLYAFPGMDPDAPCNIYRVVSGPDGVRLYLDNWPDHANPVQTLTRKALAEVGFWPVVGSIQPFQFEFGLYLRDQFGQATP